MYGEGNLFFRDLYNQCCKLRAMTNPYIDCIFENDYCRIDGAYKGKYFCISTAMQPKDRPQQKWRWTTLAHIALYEEEFYDKDGCMREMPSKDQAMKLSFIEMNLPQWTATVEELTEERVTEMHELIQAFKAVFK